MTTLAKDVYKVIRHRISTGEILIGSRVAEFALAKEFGTSRAPVREAIGKLAAEGMLERVPNVGAFVRTPDPEELRQNFELRAWIEGKAALKAAKIISKDQLKHLRQCCSDMRLLASNQEKLDGKSITEESSMQFSKLDLSFHISLLKASRNERALRFLTDQHILSNVWSAAFTPEPFCELLRTCDEHEKILDALEAGSQEVSTLLEDHISTGLDRAVEIFKKIRKRKTTASRHVALEEQLRMIEEEESSHV